MPKEWTDLLMKSNISKQEQANNPQAVLDVLQYFDTNNKQSSKYMTTHTNNGNTFNLILFQNINDIYFFSNSSTKQ